MKKALLITLCTAVVSLLSIYFWTERTRFTTRTIKQTRRDGVPTEHGVYLHLQFDRWPRTAIPLALPSD
jgi:hypothetical protein